MKCGFACATFFGFDLFTDGDGLVLVGQVSFQLVPGVPVLAELVVDLKEEEWHLKGEIILHNHVFCGHHGNIASIHLPRAFFSIKIEVRFV